MIHSRDSNQDLCVDHKTHHNNIKFLKKNKKSYHDIFAVNEGHQFIPAIGTEHSSKRFAQQEPNLFVARVAQNF